MQYDTLGLSELHNVQSKRIWKSKELEEYVGVFEEHS